MSTTQPSRIPLSMPLLSSVPRPEPHVSYMSTTQNLSWSKMRPSSLTWAIVTSMIGDRACSSDLSALCSGAVLACPVRSVVGVEGRGDTRTAARGRCAATEQSEASPVLAGSRGPGRACPDASEGATRPPDCHAGNVVALAPQAVTAVPRRQGAPAGSADEMCRDVSRWQGRPAAAWRRAARQARAIRRRVTGTARRLGGLVPGCEVLPGCP